jgi:hypothetical protein
MAELLVEGTELVVHLSAAKKVESVHGDLRIELGAAEYRNRYYGSPSERMAGREFPRVALARFADSVRPENRVPDA